MINLNKINLDKSSDGFPFIIICLFPVFLVVSHFAPTKILRKRNYNKVLLILVQAHQGSAENVTISMAINIPTDGGNAFCSYKLALGSLRLTRNCVQIDEAKFNVQRIFH